MKASKAKRKDPNRYPPGWNYERTKALIDHYENQTEDEAIAEAEAAYRNRTVTWMSIPLELAPKVRALIEKHKTAKASTRKNGHKRKRAA